MPFLPVFQVIGDDLEARVAAQLAARAPLSTGDLAITGTDVMRQLGRSPGPSIGRILARALERVIEEPSLNDRETLLSLVAELEDGS